MRLRQPLDPAPAAEPVVAAKPAAGDAAAPTAATPAQPSDGPAAAAPAAEAAAAAGPSTPAAATAQAGGSSSARPPQPATPAAPTTAPAVAKPAASKKVVPASLVEITDLLIDVIMQPAAEHPAPAASASTASGGAAGSSAAAAAAAAMDVDGGAPAAAANGDAKPAPPASSSAAAVKPPQTRLQAALQSPEAMMQHLCSYPAQQAAQAMALRLLTDSVLLFSASVNLVLKRDAELWVKAHHTPAPHAHPMEQDAAAVAAAAGGQHAPAAPGTAGKVAGRHHGKEGREGGGGAGAGASSSKHHHHHHHGKDKEKEKERDGAHVHKEALPPPPSALGAADKEKAAAAAAALQQQQHRAGSLLKRLIHVHLVAEDLPLLTQNRAERTAHLLQAVCVRSVEGRRRVVSEAVLTLLGGEAAQALAQGLVMDVKPSEEELALALGAVPNASPLIGASFFRQPGRPAPAKARALVNLVRWLLSGAAGFDPSKSPEPRSNPANLSVEMARTMRDMGMVKVRLWFPCCWEWGANLEPAWSRRGARPPQCRDGLDG